MHNTSDELETKGWQDLANCLGVDPDLFFPERGASTREAKEVCRGCVVREDCLEYALANGEKFGIWGGLSERERRRIRRTSPTNSPPATGTRAATRSVAGAGPNSCGATRFIDTCTRSPTWSPRARRCGPRTAAATSRARARSGWASHTL